MEEDEGAKRNLLSKYTYSSGYRETRNFPEGLPSLANHNRKLP